MKYSVSHEPWRKLMLGWLYLIKPDPLWGRKNTMRWVVVEEERNPDRRIEGLNVLVSHRNQGRLRKRMLAGLPLYQYMEDIMSMQRRWGP